MLRCDFSLNTVSVSHVSPRRLWLQGSSFPLLPTRGQSDSQPQSFSSRVPIRAEQPTSSWRPPTRRQTEPERWLRDERWRATPLRNDQSGGVNVAAGVAGRAAAMVKYSWGMGWRVGVFLNTAVLRRLGYVRSQFTGRLRVFITPSAHVFHRVS